MCYFSQVPLTQTDVKTILDALMYGGELEMKHSAALATAATDESGDGKKDIATRSFLYRIAPRTPSLAFLSRIPCTIVPVSTVAAKFRTSFSDFRVLPLIIGICVFILESEKKPVWRSCLSYRLPLLYCLPR